MEFFILTPLLFVFLYCLYKLIKDDYVFIRRNISLEQAFDITFWVFCSSLIVSRFFYLSLHPEKGTNMFLSFFSAYSGSFSLTGAILGGLLALYLLGKYKKVPLGRMFDFFTLAFSVVLPIGFILTSFFVKKSELLLHLVTAVVYVVITVIFWKYIYPKLINRTIKDGALTNLFLMFFSVVSLLIAMLSSFSDMKLFFSIQNAFLAGIFILGTTLFIKQERGSNRRKVK